MSSLRRVLEARDWFYLLSLLVPFTVYGVGLKAASALSQFRGAGPGGLFELLLSDLLFDLGYALLWVGAFAVLRRGRARAVLLVLLHATTILVLLVQTAAYQYFKSTGSTLDYGIIALSLAQFGEIKAVIASEVSVLSAALLAAVVLYTAFGPWLFTRALFRDRQEGRPRLPVEAAGLALLAAGFITLSGMAGGAGASFARDGFVNVVITGLGYSETARFDLSSMPGVRPMETPTDTRLVPTPRTQKKNVVFIHLESTRAFSVTPYNEEIDTTPFLQELSRHSIFAERAYTTVPHTSKAIVSVNCGIMPNLTQQITESEPNGIPARCLPDLLKEQGYDTVMFQSATEEFEDRRAVAKNFGYEEFYPLESMDTEGYDRVNYFGYEDDIMLKPSRRWLMEHRDGPFMATYLGVTGHHDYRVADRYGVERYAEDPTLNRYQNEVAYLDHFVRNVIEQYKELGLYEETIFVIYGDHGEGFGEHGRYQHDDTIYEEGLRVPLIIHVPGRFESGRRVEGLVDHLDILPTVVDLLGYRIGGGDYPGYSLLRQIPEDRTLRFSCYHDYKCLASIRGHEKYIYHYGRQPEELFDLAKDPGERHNLAPGTPRAELKRLREDLLRWRASVLAAYDGARYR
ncbi:Phosphoglycerol transferase I [Rubrobacter xylanophilus DSM 9941]|uniref:sulfatase-like hydrolase/transferase n=1 Tax=Rubrobacter xylanophilus TaxID=49319 RepID=UPI001C644397|nr:sulfatase-like hydrolase/transferase [Rubrobacter xylanophilus]QYJ16862.1 Phosphoglycerol transferase I [Rubrobacter xylanophilus DSM 9941]